MELSQRDVTLIVAGAVIVGAGVILALNYTGEPGTDSAGEAPRNEAKDMSLPMAGISSGVNMLGIEANGSLSWASRLMHTFHPLDHIAPHMDYKHYVRHRYPTISGTNVNTLIHRGYSPMMVPSSADYDWYVRPPSDDEFSGSE
jgi:hypothetical protein